MLIDSYPVEDVFARVPEVAAQTDPVLKVMEWPFTSSENIVRVPVYGPASGLT